MEECTVQIPLGWRNHLRITREEKEVVRLKNMAKIEWNRCRQHRDRKRLRELEIEMVTDVVIEA